MVPWELKWTLSGGRLDFQVDVRVSDAGQAAQRTPSVQRARACAELCISQNRQVAMLPWKRKRALSGGRLDLQGNQRFLCSRCRPGGAAYAARTRERTRARGWEVLCCAEKKSPPCPGNSSGPLAEADLISKLTCVFFQMSATRRSVRRAYARAHAGGEFCIVQNRKSRNDAPGN